MRAVCRYPNSDIIFRADVFLQHSKFLSPTDELRLCTSSRLLLEDKSEELVESETMIHVLPTFGLNSRGTFAWYFLRP